MFFFPPRCGHTQTQHSGPSSPGELWTWPKPDIHSDTLISVAHTIFPCLPLHSHASCLDQPCLLAEPVMDVAGEVEEKGLTPQKVTQGPPPSSYVRVHALVVLNCEKCSSIAGCTGEPPGSIHIPQACRISFSPFICILKLCTGSSKAHCSPRFLCMCVCARVRVLSRVAVQFKSWLVLLPRGRNVFEGGSSFFPPLCNTYFLSPRFRLLGHF